jgi:hypothetical protein
VAGGIGVSAVALQLGVAGGARGAAGLGVRVALASWALISAWLVLRAVAGAGGRVGGVSPRGRWAAWQIALAGGALVAAGLQRAPGRLVLNLIGYALCAGFAVWVAQSRGGALAAARAAAVVAVFAVVATTADLRAPLAVESTRPASAFRWSVGWPSQDWVLRHELRLPPGAPAPRELAVPLAAPYEGPARVFARVNGVDLGPLQQAPPTELRLELPGEVVGQGGRVVLELRQRPVDPAQRLIAQRWTAGATLGGTASSYFDGLEWLPGTFDDGAGRPQPGVFVLRFEGAR